MNSNQNQPKNSEPMNGYDELGQFFEEGLQKDQEAMIAKIDELTVKADGFSWALYQLTRKGAEFVRNLGWTWEKVFGHAIKFRTELEKIDQEYASITGHGIKVDNPWLKF